MLTNDFVIFIKAEVEIESLGQLTTSRMKDISVKKQGKLEEIFSRAHVEIDPEDAIDRMGHSSILASMDSQKAKAEA